MSMGSEAKLKPNPGLWRHHGVQLFIEITLKTLQTINQVSSSLVSWIKKVSRQYFATNFQLLLSFLFNLLCYAGPEYFFYFTEIFPCANMQVTTQWTSTWDTVIAQLHSCKGETPAIGLSWATAEWHHVSESEQEKTLSSFTLLDAVCSRSLENRWTIVRLNSHWT